MYCSLMGKYRIIRRENFTFGFKIHSLTIAIHGNCWLRNVREYDGKFFILLVTGAQFHCSFRRTNMAAFIDFKVAIISE